MTTATAAYRGIDGLQGREPVGAVLTIGQKNDRGGIDPKTTDRFWFAVPTMGQDNRRALHPEFGTFNQAPTAKRQTIHGNLVHTSERDAWEWSLKAQVLPDPWKAHPDKRPACVGDGKNATRYDPDGRLNKPDEDGFVTIACPNEQCEFRRGDSKVCKPWGRLYFRTRWLNGSLPETLTKWSTGSWNSVRNIVGFFEHVHAQAKSLGLEDYSLYGLPFVLTLSRKTKPSEKRSFPVVSIAPECDLVAFFLQQRQQLRELGTIPEPKLIAAGAQDPEENDPEAVYADHANITPGHVRKPAVVQVESRGPAPEGEAGEPPDVPDLDERWDRLLRKAKAWGLGSNRLHDAVQAVVKGGFPDALPEDDVKIEQVLQKMARTKK